LSSIFLILFKAGYQERPLHEPFLSKDDGLFEDDEHRQVFQRFPRMC